MPLSLLLDSVSSNLDVGADAVQTPKARGIPLVVSSGTGRRDMEQTKHVVCS
jgi:hypothetical protein